MSNPAHQFSVEVSGELKEFFTNEAEAENYANQLIASFTLAQDERKIITITNGGLLDVVSYSHKYWSWSNKKWINVVVNTDAQD